MNYETSLIRLAYLHPNFNFSFLTFSYLLCNLSFCVLFLCALVGYRYWLPVWRNKDIQGGPKSKPLLNNKKIVLNRIK